MPSHGLTNKTRQYPIRTTIQPQQGHNWWSMGATMPSTMPKDVRNYPQFNRQTIGLNVGRIR
jgi:hypothetical protein